MKPPTADPQPWHVESIAAWDSFYIRSEVGRKKRKQIRQKWEQRVQ